MEFSKEKILQLKATIKSLAAEQKIIKPQRKTVHFTGERTMPVWKAVGTHSMNRYTLRHSYIAYGMMRGKSLEQIEGKSKTEANLKLVSQIMQSYAEVVCGDPQ